MSWKNSRAQWGWLFIFIHWTVALSVLGLYLLGWYMVDLDYYDSWYRSAPFWHKSVGLLLCGVIFARLVLRLIQGVPDSLPSHANWEVALAKVTHTGLYALLVLVFVSGYFISTADGRGVSFFAWFEIPALVSDIDNLEDLAGEIHEYATDALMLLAVFHAAGAIKHHVLDKDVTLKRMLGFK